jgi:hypothetical protein
LSQWVTRATREANTRKSAPPATGKTGYGALIAVSNSVQWLRRQNRYWRCPEPPEIPTRFLWKPEYIALRGLISETNVFNLIDQKQ